MQMNAMWRFEDLMSTRASTNPRSDVTSDLYGYRLPDMRLPEDEFYGFRVGLLEESESLRRVNVMHRDTIKNSGYEAEIAWQEGRYEDAAKLERVGLQRVRQKERGEKNAAKYEDLALQALDPNPILEQDLRRRDLTVSERFAIRIDDMRQAERPLGGVTTSRKVLARDRLAEKIREREQNNASYFSNMFRTLRQDPSRVLCWYGTNCRTFGAERDLQKWKDGLASCKRPEVKAVLHELTDAVMKQKRNSALKALLSLEDLQLAYAKMDSRLHRRMVMEVLDIMRAFLRDPEASVRFQAILDLILPADIQKRACKEYEAIAREYMGPNCVPLKCYYNMEY